MHLLLASRGGTASPPSTSFTRNAPCTAVSVYEGNTRSMYSSITLQQQYVLITADVLVFFSCGMSLLPQALTHICSWLKATPKSRTLRLALQLPLLPSYAPTSRRELVPPQLFVVRNSQLAAVVVCSPLYIFCSSKVLKSGRKVQRTLRGAANIPHVGPANHLAEHLLPAAASSRASCSCQIACYRSRGEF